MLQHYGIRIQPDEVSLQYVSITFPVFPTHIRRAADLRTYRKLRKWNPRNAAFLPIQHDRRTAVASLWSMSYNNILIGNEIVPE